MGYIRFEKINNDNVYDIINLKLRKEQEKFVAKNIYSIVHAYLELAENNPVFPFGIYNDKQLVGFIMVGYDIFRDRQLNPKCEWFMKNSYIIWRLMIDEKYQGEGYGKEAVSEALKFINTFPCGAAEYCWVSYEVDNITAKKLFETFGFKEITDAFIEGGEMPALIKLNGDYNE